MFAALAVDAELAGDRFGDQVAALQPSCFAFAEASVEEGEHQRAVREGQAGKRQDLGLEEDVGGLLRRPGDRVEPVYRVALDQLEADGPAEEVVDVAEAVPS